MIQFVTGNFFDYKADIRINTVNCVGAMGAGVALQFKNKYPEMNKEYVKACNDGTIQIGRPQVWTNTDFFNEEDNVIIINFPTKLHWKNPSEYEYIEKGLEWLVKFLKSHENKTITVPALGCGHGGLNWTIVKEMIVKSLSSLNLKILVFEPESSNSKNAFNIEKKLNEKHIKQISPNDFSYPKRLLGKSGTDIFIQGNVKTLNKSILSFLVDSKPSEKEKKIVFECIENFDYDKYTLLLGFNSSFEVDIVKTVLEKKEPIIIALPYGLLNLKLRKDLLNLWDDSLITVISISEPTSKWNISDAIKMLKFRLKISDTLLFTYNDFSKISKYKEDIVRENNNRFFINYWNETIPFYNEIKAKKIGKSKDTNKPNLNPLFEK
jgi:O-acetyl-ADP-ribose deacetylase (regulator of RNase III)